MPIRLHLVSGALTLVLSVGSVKSLAAAPNPLSRYEGAWQVTRKSMPPGSKPDILSNQCSPIGRYFACQQTTNGTPGGLLVFLPAHDPGHYYTQTIMPDGRATGRDDLTINGDQWTYLSRRDQNGRTTFYRTTNVFTGNAHIHFEQAESSDGNDWKVQNSGDEVRVSASAKAPR